MPRVRITRAILQRCDWPHLVEISDILQLVSLSFDCTRETSIMPETAAGPSCRTKRAKMQMPPGNPGVVPEDLDLDHVLDNYLVQLQSDMNSSAPGMAPLGLQGLGQDLGMPQGLAGGGLGGQGLGMHGAGNMMQHQGLPGGLPAALLSQAGILGFGGQDPGGLGLDPQALARLMPEGGQGMSSGLNSNAQPSGRGRARNSGDAKHGRSKPESHDHDSDAQSSDGSASSGEQKSRKKREISNDDDLSVAERRHLALQEKNRRAQRRFRERQKVRLSWHLHMFSTWDLL